MPTVDLDDVFGLARRLAVRAHERLRRATRAVFLAVDVADRDFFGLARRLAVRAHERLVFRFILPQALVAIFQIIRTDDDFIRRLYGDSAIRTVDVLLARTIRRFMIRHTADGAARIRHDEVLARQLIARLFEHRVHTRRLGERFSLLRFFELCSKRFRWRRGWIRAEAEIAKSEHELLRVQPAPLADQLSGVMEIIKRNAALSSNKLIDENKLNKEKKALAEDADKRASVWHTTSEVWDDGVIDPTETRKYLSLALAAVYSSDIKGTDSFGIFRM